VVLSDTNWSIFKNIKADSETLLYLKNQSIKEQSNALRPCLFFTLAFFNPTRKNPIGYNLFNFADNNNWLDTGSYLGSNFFKQNVCGQAY